MASSYLDDMFQYQSDESWVTPRVRRKVLERDDWICQFCGESDLSQLTVHHVVFRSQGGGHTPDNLVTLCGRCHMRVHQHTLEVMCHNGHWFFREVNPRQGADHG